MFLAKRRIFLKFLLKFLLVLSGACKRSIRHFVPQDTSLALSRQRLIIDHLANLLGLLRNDLKLYNKLKRLIKEASTIHLIDRDFAYGRSLQIAYQCILAIGELPTRQGFARYYFLKEIYKITSIFFNKRVSMATLFTVL